MNVAPYNSPNLDFDIGAQARCRGESCGKLGRVVIDPDSDSVVSLIIEQGFLQKESRVIPLRLVLEASPDTIELDVDRDDLDRYPEYDEVEYAVPSDDWRHDQYQVSEAAYWTPPYRTVVEMPVVPMVRQTIHEGIPSTQEVIGKGTPVRDRTDEDLGHIDHVLTSRESGAITHLVIDTGGLLRSDLRVVPIGRVIEIDDQGVIIDVQDRELEDMPEYREDRPTA
jgi:uncharacterized protein YrrD